jgi:hypothetical protein
LIETNKMVDTNTMNPSEEASNPNSQSHHQLSDKWVLWAHLPHDTDWTAPSYKHIYSFDTIEMAISLFEVLPEKMVTNCMLFLMRDGVQPMWEDPKNRNGGCFSYRITNKQVPVVWKNLSYSLIGKSITDKSSIFNIITGITISPKKHFCIIKIWLENCKIQNPSVINYIDGLESHGCLFKRHNPQY